MRIALSGGVDEGEETQEATSAARGKPNDRPDRHGESRPKAVSPVNAILWMTFACLMALNHKLAAAR